MQRNKVNNMIGKGGTARASVFTVIDVTCLLWKKYGGKQRGVSKKCRDASHKNSTS